ncbi:DMT family transporter [Dawidia soli]|uniref:EamA family transporter n=1 Tax=Dawidia soli TaxID=2782352 RepID=A0AAP2DAB0_9BACT|nr:EamA family transporter [Dawidia soli]MBT1688184.1 EamA family transporter [Dawidia soli]
MKRDLLFAYLALVAICIIWGTTFLAMRMAVVDFPPFLFTVIRQITAGSILVVFMLTIGKVKVPNKRYILRQALAGFLMISVGNGFVAWAEVHIPSGIAAVICSFMPVVVILLNMAIQKDERPTMPIMLGVALGAVGIALIFGEHLSDFARPEYVMGIVMTLTAVMSWATGMIWMKKHSADSNPFLNAGLQMLFGGLWLIPFSLLFDDLHAIPWTAKTLLPLAYLIVFGSVIAYTCYSYALRKLPVTIVSLYAYVNPLVAVVLGWLVLDEKLNTRMGIAILLTIAGIYIVNRGYQLRNAWKAQLSHD